jgi:3',5'-nucleoside bisphosphate phosphatase
VLLATEKWQDAVQAARDQGAFIFWNHPGWPPQLTDGQIKWHPEHTQLLEQDLLHGIEIVNARYYYPEAHRWAIEKKLTLFSNSDIHQPIHHDYHLHAGDHRPLTLVFVRERSVDAIKEALFARRTAVYAGGRLLGEERFLRPIFDASVRVLNPSLTLRGRERGFVQIHNNSDVEFTLERTAEPDGMTVPEKVTLAARKTVLAELRARTASGAGGARKIVLPFRATNVLTAPDQPLEVALELEVTFTR